MTAYLKFTMQKNDGAAFIKPGEIVQFSLAPEGGSRIVTRQEQIYYVSQNPDQVIQMIDEFFEKIKGDY